MQHRSVVAIQIGLLTQLRQLMDRLEIPRSLRPGIVDLVINVESRRAFSATEVSNDIVTRISGGLVHAREEMDRVVRVFEKAENADIAAFLSSPEMSVYDVAALV